METKLDQGIKSDLKELYECFNVQHSRRYMIKKLFESLCEKFADNVDCNGESLRWVIFCCKKIYVIKVINCLIKSNVVHKIAYNEYILELLRRLILGLILIWHKWHFPDKHELIYR